MTTDLAGGRGEGPVIERVGSRIEYQPALDGMRGIAVLLVLIYHDGLLRARPGGLRGGFLGVDIFFVLSGYLITSLLLSEHASKGRIAFKSFWSRRARRLIPAMLVMLLGVALYSATIAAPEELSQIRGDAIATLLYVQNWHLIIHHHRFGTALDHTWSLSVEEQWYLAWPLLLALLLSWRRVRASRLFAVIAGLAAVSAIWTYVLYHNGSGLDHAYYGTDARAQELLIGAGLAVLLRHWLVGTSRSRRGVELVGLVGCVATAAIVLLSTSGSQFFAYGGYTVLAVAVAAVIAAAVQPSSQIVRPLLSTLPLRKIGIISYGLYLYHWPMYFWLSSERTHLSGAALLLLRVAAAIAAATLSYFLVERPIRRGALKGLRLRLGAPVAIAVVVAATLLATRPVAPPPPPLLASSTVAGYRRIAAQPGRRVLVVGRGMAFGLGLYGGRYTRSGWNGSSIGFLDCSFLSGDIYFPAIGVVPEASHCDQFLPALRSLRAAFRPDIVVLLPSSGELYDRRVGSQVFQVGTSAWAGYATSRLDTVLAALKPSERTQVLLASVPCNAAPNKGSAFDTVTHNASRQRTFNEVLQAYARAHPLVRYGDLDSVLCRGGAPIGTLGGHRLFDSLGALTRDGDHDLWDWIIRNVAS